MIQSVKTIVFDFDGTIANSFSSLLGVFEDITDRQQKLTPTEIDDLRKKTLKEILDYLEVKKWQIPRLIIKAKKAMAIKITDIKPFDGLPQVIKTLHQDGYRLFILSSNSSKIISKFLKANNMDSYFVSVYGDIGLRSKASALKKLMKKEHITKAQCVYIGDEVRDIEASRKISITHVAVGWGFNHPSTLKDQHPTALAMKPRDLLTIL